jgi:hypothetical protein
MKKSDVPFVQLRSFLEGMGFHVVRLKKGWRFEHKPSGTIFLFRSYREADRVYAHDLLRVRSHLDLRGMLSVQAFDESMSKMPA